MEPLLLLLPLPQWRGPLRDIYALWPDGKLLTARARLLRDFLRDRIAVIPQLQGELPPTPDEAG